MFNLTAKDSKNAIDLLKADHKKVKELFEQFEETDDRKVKTQIVKKALEELSIHATLEEELFYPAIRAEIGDDDEDMMDEADEEHHVAKVLIAELEEMKDSESHYDAKFTVLAENVRHHIKEEEGEMFPKAKDTDIDFDALGEEMLSRKGELMREGVPQPAEASMVGKNGNRGDSPAKAAKRTTKTSKKTVKGGR